MWGHYDASPEIKPLEPPLGYDKSNDGVDLSCGCNHVTSLDIEPLEPPLGCDKLNGGAVLSYRCSVDNTGTHKHRPIRDHGFSVDLPSSGNCGSDQDRGCNVALSRSGKYESYQDCGFDQDRGCRVDLSRNGNYGSYRDSCWVRVNLSSLSSVLYFFLGG
ncbi:hypothetical protein V6N13_149296 [Hibiscus sabdariffa]